MSANPKGTALPHVAICIATYLRPQGLQKLIESLNTQFFDDNQVHVTIIIADNAPEATAESTLGEIQHLTQWKVIYVVEHVRGIVSARNRALTEVPTDVDLIAFLDDDEYVSDCWLASMLETINIPNTAAVQGPVEPNYSKQVPAWMEKLNLFRMGPYKQGAELKSAATNNSMVDAAIVRDLGLRFDPRFNITGGEDEEFFSRLREAGGTIRAAAKALVWDDVPQNRTTISWLGRRWFRKGNTLGRIALIRRRGIFLRAAKGVGVICWGCLTCIFLGFGSKARWHLGLLEIFRGLGMLTALLGVNYCEYNNTAIKVDRPGGH